MKNKILRNLILYILLFVALVAGSILVLKISYALFNKSTDNILFDGYKVGLIAWLILVIYHNLKRKK